MSFGISAVGRARNVAAKIAQQPAYTTDSSQLDRVKAFLAEELAAVSPKVPVQVTVSGHHDRHSHSLTLTIQHVILADEEPDNIDQRTRDAYDAYAVATGGINHLGEPMPAWDDLGDQIQTAWKAAITAGGATPAAPTNEPGKDESS